MDFNCTARKAAIIAFRVSPGKKAVAPTRPAQTEVCVMIAIMGAPIRLTSTTPKTKLMINNFHVFKDPHTFSEA